MGNHIITRNIGNLRGFSTDSIFTKPPNVADEALNIQKAPDGTFQIRRGYQCEIATIGGMGIGTLDNPAADTIETVCVSTDGFLYNKLTKQIFINYNNPVSGPITAVTNAAPAELTSTAHGLVTGQEVFIQGVNGPTSINNLAFTITVVDLNTFSLDGSDTSADPVYIDGGIWTIPTSVSQVTGPISNITNANPAVVESIGHGLVTGASIIIRSVNGMILAGVPAINGQTFIITVIDADNFSLNGFDTTLFSAYVSGGTWTVSYTDQRYLVFSIYVDPALIYTNLNQSINVKIIANQAAAISGNALVATNVINVLPGHNIRLNNIIQFVTSPGVQETRQVVSVTATTITIDGAAVIPADGQFIAQVFIFAFGKGFDVSLPVTINDFITAINDPNNGVPGLQIAINGEGDLPAAFFEIIEPTIISPTLPFKKDYWYWHKINSIAGIGPPFPGSADIDYQNSQDFENASMAVFDDVIYIANGIDFPQKYDNQTVYRAGMPAGARTIETENVAFTSRPFTAGETYEYGITYEQIDNIGGAGHLVEGELSETSDETKYTVTTTPSATNVSVNNLEATVGANWNLNGATFRSTATAMVYGPDINNFYYDLVNVTAGYTLKIGDTAYYEDRKAAIITAAQVGVFTINVLVGHSIVAGDIAYFFDSVGAGPLYVQKARVVVSVTATSITIQGEPVTVNPALDAEHSFIKVFKTSKVFGNVAIVDKSQNNVNVIVVKDTYPNPGPTPTASFHTIQVGNTVNFIDSNGNNQRRTVLAVTATTITIDGIPVSVNDLVLISSEETRSNQLNFQRLNVNGISSITGSTENSVNISNNLRINIYRTKKNESFDVNGKLYLIASIPNGLGGGVQAYIDGLNDDELLRAYDNPIEIPNPPPVSKYLRAFGNQLFYAGGKRGEAENSDRVFFSEGNNPEIVPLAVNSFNVPNVDDDITGIGVSGTTLVTTKNHSLWSATGNFLSSDIDVVQIAPGTNIGCVAHASIACIGGMMYFLHTSGVYAITENQLYPTDAFDTPVPISLAIDSIFRENEFLPQNKLVFKRAVAVNFTKDNQYLLFIPCEDTQSTIRTANANSIILCYDYQGKNWFKWNNMNAAGGIFVIDDNLYFQERRTSGIAGNVANLYKQHRFYRLVDHSDHAGAQYASWLSSWEDMGQPEVRKKFSKCVLLMDRLSELYQLNNPQIVFNSYLNRIGGQPSTISNITQTNNTRNSAWGATPWGINSWSGYQDTFVTVNLKQGTVAKSIAVGFKIQGINMDIKLSGFQLEAIPENRMTVVR